MNRSLASIFCTLCLVITIRAGAADNGIADMPYMGWSSWSCFQKNFDEQKIIAQVDVMADKLKKYGFTYINIDAGWHNDKDFDEHGRRLPDAKKFPQGIQHLADYVHSKGLKLGLYIEPGMPVEAYNQNGVVLGTDIHIAGFTDATQQANTLDRNFYRIDFKKPGAKQWVDSSADLLTSWGVDFIKCDFVGPNTHKKVDSSEDVKLWYLALQRHRPVWFELSNNLLIENAEFYRQYSNGWRIDNDVEKYRSDTVTDWPHVLRRFKDAPAWAKFAGKGGWNDLDSLEIGCGAKTGLTFDERRTTMTLWCICCAPLYLGVDLTKLVDEDWPIISNTEAIEIDQAGVAAIPISQETPQQVWRAKNADGSFTVALFNLADEEAPAKVAFSDLGLTGPGKVRDLWEHSDVADSVDQFSTSLQPHACRLLRISPISK
jgi:hypothetical protein